MHASDDIARKRNMKLSRLEAAVSRTNALIDAPSVVLTK